MKINICKHIYNFFGFVVQPSMLWGYDEHNKQFVTNGNKYGNYFWVYFNEGETITGKPIWRKRKVFENHRPKFFAALERKSKSTGRKCGAIMKKTDYLTPLTLEAARHQQKVHNNNSNGNGYEVVGINSDAPNCRTPNTQRMVDTCCSTHYIKRQARKEAFAINTPVNYEAHGNSSFTYKKPTRNLLIKVKP